MNYKKLGVVLIAVAFIAGCALIIFPTILNPEQLLMIEATPFYRNAVIISMINWVFILGIAFFIKKN